MALSPVRLRASMIVGSADAIALTRANSPALIASMKAAALSVMPRFYLSTAQAGLKACTTSRVVQSFRSAVPLIAIIFSTRHAGAQTAPPFHDRPPLGAEITVGPIA